MHAQILAWQFIRENLQQKLPVMLLYVIDSKGSSPGRQGFMMTVNTRNEMRGSIGGGIMEHKFVELAKSRLLQQEQTPAIHEQFHDKTAAKNQSGMICSGAQTIFMYCVQERDEKNIQLLIQSLEANQNGTLQLSPGEILFTPTLPVSDYEFIKGEENDFLYKEKTGYKNHLYIIGGGHCALAFSQLVNGMDFFIHLVEDRNGLNTMEQNNFVQEKKMVDDYNEIGSHIPEGENIYVVLMTFGYRTDMTALRALLPKQFKYLGILGSQKKIGKMFTELQEEGIAPRRLNNIYAPIGLPIKSQTPQEIAVSIVAEIIQVKNQHF